MLMLNVGSALEKYVTNGEEILARLHGGYWFWGPAGMAGWISLLGLVVVAIVATLRHVRHPRSARPDASWFCELVHVQFLFFTLCACLNVLQDVVGYSGISMGAALWWPFTNDLGRLLLALCIEIVAILVLMGLVNLARRLRPRISLFGAASVVCVAVDVVLTISAVLLVVGIGQALHWE